LSPENVRRYITLLLEGAQKATPEVSAEETAVELAIRPSKRRSVTGRRPWKTDFYRLMNAPAVSRSFAANAKIC